MKLRWRSSTRPPVASSRTCTTAVPTRCWKSGVVEYQPRTPTATSSRSTTLEHAPADHTERDAPETARSPEAAAPSARGAACCSCGTIARSIMVPPRRAAPSARRPRHAEPSASRRGACPPAAAAGSPGCGRGWQSTFGGARAGWRTPAAGSCSIVLVDLRGLDANAHAEALLDETQRDHAVVPASAKLLFGEAIGGEVALPAGVGLAVVGVGRRRWPCAAQAMSAVTSSSVIGGQGLFAILLQDQGAIDQAVDGVLRAKTLRCELL